MISFIFSQTHCLKPSIQTFPVLQHNKEWKINLKTYLNDEERKKERKTTQTKKSPPTKETHLFIDFFIVDDKKKIKRQWSYIYINKRLKENKMTFKKAMLIHLYIYNWLPFTYLTERMSFYHQILTPKTI